MNKNQDPELREQSYVGLLQAEEKVRKVLRKMMGGVPLEYLRYTSDSEETHVFISTNGLCLTVHLQEFRPISLVKKGGRG
ncbi:MAG: hypothetical protein LBS20_10860 [Prevotella sp.]|jgi:hypothetical protein|nr:hypothetical protein [Prevotella sp.]